MPYNSYFPASYPQYYPQYTGQQFNTVAPVIDVQNANLTIARIA